MSNFHDHEPTSFFWEAGSEHCPHGAEPRTATADEAQQAGEQPAYPPVLRWRIELYDPLAEEWNPGSSLGKRQHIVDHFQALEERTPEWKDGTPVQRRIVRETTTYTIEEPK